MPSLRFLCRIQYSVSQAADIQLKRKVEEEGWTGRMAAERQPQATTGTGASRTSVRPGLALDCLPLIYKMMPALDVPGAGISVIL